MLAEAMGGLVKAVEDYTGVKLPQKTQDENKGTELNFLCESADEFIKENEKELKYLFGESWQEEGLDTWNDKMNDYANDNR
jgi:hypothetical protein